MQYAHESKSKDFQEIVEKVEAYYKDKDKGKGSGYKQFKRWEYDNRTRLSPDGKLVDVAKLNFDEFYYYNENHKGKGNTVANTTGRGINTVAGDWQPVGPSSYREANEQYGGGLGRLNCIAVDPSNDNVIYVGAPGGGIWKTENGGNSWTALTDGIPKIGISGIAIDYSSPTTNRTIYALTGDGNAEHTKSVGVLKSMDNGRTWYSTGLGADLDLRAYAIKNAPNQFSDSVRTSL